MNRAAQQGFTLLEMIVVLVIIGMLMGLVGPRLFNQADKAKAQTADTQVKMLKGALLTMRLDIGRLPTEEEGLALLNTPPSDERLGGLLARAPPPGAAYRWTWNRPYLQYSDGAGAEQPFTLQPEARMRAASEGKAWIVSVAPKR